MQLDEVAGTIRSFYRPDGTPAAPRTAEPFPTETLLVPAPRVDGTSAQNEVVNGVRGHRVRRSVMDRACRYRGLTGPPVDDAPDWEYGRLLDRVVHRIEGTSPTGFEPVFWP